MNRFFTRFACLVAGSVSRDSVRLHIYISTPYNVYFELWGVLSTVKDILNIVGDVQFRKKILMKMWGYLTSPAHV